MHVQDYTGTLDIVSSALLDPIGCAAWGIGVQGSGLSWGDLVMSLQASSAHWRAARKLMSCMQGILLIIFAYMLLQ